MVLDWMRIESERRLDRGERGRQGGGETCITRTGLRPYDTLTGFNVVSLRHTGAATLILSRGGPVPCWKGGREGGDRVYCEDSHCQGGGRKVSRGGQGTLDRERREGNYFTVGFVS